MDHNQGRIDVDRMEKMRRDLLGLAPRPAELPMMRVDSALRDMERAKAEEIAAASAGGFARRLITLINEFDAKLDSAHEVGIRLVSFGQTVQFSLDDVSFLNPSLIIFHGRRDGGDRVELIQHVSQISILLMAIQRNDTSEPKRPIGFHSEEA